MLEAAAKLAESDEIKPKPRAALRQVAANFARWSELLDNTPHTELAEIVLEESGYTEDVEERPLGGSPGRLDKPQGAESAPWRITNSLRSFLEHVALVMDTRAERRDGRRLHHDAASAKGLEFQTVFLPAGEEALFPHQRALARGPLGLEVRNGRLADVRSHPAPASTSTSGSPRFPPSPPHHRSTACGQPPTTPLAAFLDELPASLMSRSQAHLLAADSALRLLGLLYWSGARPRPAVSVIPPQPILWRPSALFRRPCRVRAPSPTPTSTPGWARAQANR